MTAATYGQFGTAPARDRLDLFLSAAGRLSVPINHVEKDFWVCWTLNMLYRERPAGGPRLLFKGGTSLSKAYGPIQRLSEDIDITVFRDDLDEPGSVEELEALLLARPERCSSARGKAGLAALLRPTLSPSLGRQQTVPRRPGSWVDCVRYARMFFNRPDYDLSSALPGTFSVAPTGVMVVALSRDYANTTAMIFVRPPLPSTKSWHLSIKSNGC